MLKKKAEPNEILIIRFKNKTILWWVDVRFETFDWFDSKKQYNQIKKYFYLIEDKYHIKKAKKRKK